MKTTLPDFTNEVLGDVNDSELDSPAENAEPLLSRFVCFFFHFNLILSNFFYCVKGLDGRSSTSSPVLGKSKNTSQSVLLQLQLLAKHHPDLLARNSSWKRKI